MIRSSSTALAFFVFAAGAMVAPGCAAPIESASSESENVLQEAEALSVDTDGDAVEEAATSDADIEAAADEEAAGAGADAVGDAPSDIGCGLRKTVRARIKDHFDANGDGKLDESERAELVDAVGGHPRAKLAFAKMGLRVRHQVFRHIKWAYDVDGDGKLDDAERAALSSAVQARCEARKARALAKYDANANGADPNPSNGDDRERQRRPRRRRAARGDRRPHEGPPRSSRLGRPELRRER